MCPPLSFDHRNIKINQIESIPSPLFNYNNFKNLDNRIKKELKKYIFETFTIWSRNNSTSKYKQFFNSQCAFLLFGKTSNELRLQFNAKQSSTTKLQFLSVTYIHERTNVLLSLKCTWTLFHQPPHWCIFIW